MPFAARVIQGFFSPGRPRIAVQPSTHGRSLPPTLYKLPVHGSGQRLPIVIQRRMEQAFGTDFSGVRIHVGPEAAAIGAFAFTLGTDIYFAPGQYDPHRPHGQRLIAHELTHVVQQRAGRVRAPAGPGLAVVQDPLLEAEAERMAARLGNVPGLAAVPLPHRQPARGLQSHALPARRHEARPVTAGAAQRSPVPGASRPLASHVRAALGRGAVQPQVRQVSGPPASGVIQCHLTDDRKIELKLIARNMPGIPEAQTWLNGLNGEEQGFVLGYYNTLMAFGFWPSPQQQDMSDSEDDEMSEGPPEPPACAPLTLEEAQKISKYKLAIRVGQGPGHLSGACYSLCDFGDDYRRQQHPLHKIQWIFNINGASGRQWGDLLAGTILNIVGLERTPGSHLLLLRDAGTGLAERYKIWGQEIYTLAKTPRVPPEASTVVSVPLAEDPNMDQLVQWVRQSIASLPDPGEDWF